MDQGQCLTEGKRQKACHGVGEVTAPLECVGSVGPHKEGPSSAPEQLEFKHSQALGSGGPEQVVSTLVSGNGQS
jgi:hypothetical protein